ncbi:Sfum_1244 family protein [Thiolapillus sp.]
MNRSVEKIRQQVQYNCHIADARHGGDFTMCTYLLKMREFFRWERGLGMQTVLPRDELGDWLMAREALWESLDAREFAPLCINGREYEPFDVAAINGALEPHGLVYSAGLANGSRANFFLGELLEREHGEGGFVLHLSGREHARCLSAPPAMAAGREVFLRREALARYLWEKYEAWGWNRPDNALGKAFAHYDFANDAESALARMTDVELAAAREHELGECEASELLGEAWNEMLLDLSLTPAELMARAVKDHLADALRTLPMLLREANPASLHFYAGNLSGMRRHLFPALTEAYGRWQETGDMAALVAVVDGARDHWLDLARDMMALHQRLGVASAETMRRLVLERCGVEE